MRKKGKPRGNSQKIVPFRWKPGQSGNPKGRPRKEPLTDILRAVLAEKVPNAQDPRQSLAHALIKNWVLEAIRTKDTAMIVEIFNRIEGKVRDRHAVGGEEVADAGAVAERDDIKKAHITQAEINKALDRIRVIYGLNPITEKPSHSAPDPAQDDVKEGHG
jgi:hypothetical protein